MRLGQRTMALAALPTLLLLVGCSGEDRRPELLVGAASSLEPLLGELAERFERDNEVEVTFVFSASGTIAQQIEQGAPIDVFASANAAFMDRLELKGLLAPGTRSLFGRGLLALVRPDGSRRGTGLLADAERVAIANPEIAPYGTAAKALMQSNGVWDEIKDSIVFGESAVQVLQFVTTGEVDFGFVPFSLLARPGQELPVTVEQIYSVIPGHPLEQSAAVIASSTGKTEAAAFVALLADETFRDAIEQYGYAGVVGSGRAGDS